MADPLHWSRRGYAHRLSSSVPAYDMSADCPMAIQNESLWIASWLGPLVTDRNQTMVPGRTLEG